MLIAYPFATADGTDSIQMRRQDSWGEALQSELAAWDF